MGIDVCNSGKSNEHQQQDDHGLYLGTWNKKYKEPGCSDKDHKCCIWKMTDGHQKCVGKSILDGIVKFRKNRVEVQEDHQVNDQDHHKQYHKNLTDGARCAAQMLMSNTAKSSHKHDQIDHNTLFQILFKGFKKSADDIRLFITNHFQSDVEHGGNGRSNGHHRNAADNASRFRMIRSATLLMKVKNLLSMLKKRSEPVLEEGNRSIPTSAPELQ